jgi:hypothetical protein
MWSESPESCRRIVFSSPILSEAQLEWLRGGASALDARFQSPRSRRLPVEDGEEALERAVGGCGKKRSARFAVALRF